MQLLDKEVLIKKGIKCSECGSEPYKAFRIIAYDYDSKKCMDLCQRCYSKYKDNGTF